MCFSKWKLWKCTFLNLNQTLSVKKVLIIDNVASRVHSKILMIRWKEANNKKQINHAGIP